MNITIGGILGWIGVALLVFLCAVHPGCTSGNAEWVKARAAETFKQNGFQVTGYQGWNVGGQIAPAYGGACVWYTLKKVPDNGITYEGCLQRWGAELHLYSLRAIDAIKPQH